MVDKTVFAPFVPQQPGDLLMAEHWNVMQVMTQEFVSKSIGDAIAGVKEVDRAKDADQLGGMATEALLKYILNQVFAQIPKRTGYMKVLCNLNKDVDKVIEHKLGDHPVVDVYQLSYFKVACAKGEEDSQVRAEFALFYLYHSDERRVRVGETPIDIETTPKFRMLWKPILDKMKEEKRLNFTDETTLDDLEADFWRAMFAAPNDEFDADSYCHSPWFEKCCGEKRRLRELNDHGDWDNLYLKMMPEKTVNIIPAEQQAPIQKPTDVRVSHLDADTVVLRHTGTWSDPGLSNVNNVASPAEGFGNYMPSMVLLKA
ncbi:hypothetical protein [Caballeronia novacaledonica]|uniref:Uncharacterized protein n=1 Tax=Caballeronia novacaledonica TaxID=1544861 RepID=A0AA37MUD7_9BURK|nr:hypothetical protein [Caballeronia novacaledonica]GJH28934.1 hypothetical protein CBA19CS42_30480 [Caballeronia novacaledonica]